MTVIAASGPCPHGVIDDVCWDCTPRELYVKEWERSIADLHDCHDIGPIGTAWRQRAAQHLADRLQRALRQGLPVLPSNEEQAMALIRSVAKELEEAAQALDIAAARFKNIAYQGSAANHAHIAAMKARQAARGLIGD